MRSPAERPATAGRPSPLRRPAQGDHLHVAPRPPKDALLPQIVQLALEGESGRAIARKLGLPERTVNHWLKEARREWTAKAADGAAEMIGIALARLESIYREAMEAWRDSRANKETRLVEDVTTADGRAKQKSSVRTESQCGNAALLGKAMEAAKAICCLVAGNTPLPRTAVASRDGGSAPTEQATTQDLEALAHCWQGLAKMTGLDADSCHLPPSTCVTPKGLENPAFSPVFQAPYQSCGENVCT